MKRDLQRNRINYLWWPLRKLENIVRMKKYGHRCFKEGGNGIQASKGA